MAQSRTNFEELLKFGQEGEKEVALLFINYGYSILPLYQFDAIIAPKIIIEKEYISPDLTIFKEGKCVFLEVKRKNQWVVYKDRTETGCDYRHYLEYLNLSKNTGIDLYMVFQHLDAEPTGIYLVNILEEGRYWDGTVGGVKKFKPMFFWNFDKLHKIQ